MEFNSLVGKIFHNWHVKILSISAAVLLFVFNRMVNLEEAVLSIPLAIRLPMEYSLSEPVGRDAVSITIRGDRELGIYDITENEVEVFADLSQITTKGSHTTRIQFVLKGRAKSLTPLSISIDPQMITISIEKTIQKSVQVKANVKSAPQPGYDFTLAFTPGTVAISGPKNRVDAVEFVWTESLDLSMKTESFTTIVSLVQPDPLVVLSGAKQAELECTIEEGFIEKSMQVRIIGINLIQRLRFDATAPDEGTLVIKYTPQFQEKFKKTDFVLAVDCGSIRAPGRYNLRCRPVVTEGFIVEEFSPPEAVVTIAGG